MRTQNIFVLLKDNNCTIKFYFMEKDNVNPGMKELDKLIGKWKVSGDAKGQIEYKWAEGGFFLVQDVDLEYGGKQIRGIEMVGYLHRVAEAPSKEIWSRFYSYLDGLTLDYVYEFAGDTLTIWFGKKDSDNFYKGKISEDSFNGAWQWPGGGYSVTGKKIK
jgi:hypothetical protein